MKGKVLIPKIVLTTFLSCSCAAVVADDGVPGAGHENSDKYQWRQLDGEFTVNEYRKTYKHNKRMLRSAVKLYSESAAESMGMPRMAGKMVGGAAGMAASVLTNHDVRLGLTESKNFAVQITDPAENDRALFLNYRIKW